jgi:hypothetical protein
MTTLSKKGWVPAAVHGCDVYPVNLLVEMCVMQFTVEGEVPEIKIDEPVVVQENALLEGNFDPEEVERIAHGVGNEVVIRLERLKSAIEGLGFVDVRVAVLQTRAFINYRGNFPTRLLILAKDPNGQDPGLWGVVELRTIRDAVEAAGFLIPELKDLSWGGLWGITTRTISPGEVMLGLSIEVESPIRDGFRVPPRPPKNHV